MQYDSPVSSNDLVAGLQQHAMNAATLEAIQAILQTDTTEQVVVANYTEANGFVRPDGAAPQAVLVDLSDRPAGERVQFDIPDDILSIANAYVFDTDADLILTFNTVERVIALGNGDDLVLVGGDSNTTIDGGYGNDTIITSGGDDSVIAGAGDDWVSTGAGNDTIVSGQGNDTIDGGTGFDMIQAGGTVAQWDIQFEQGFGYVVLVDAEGGNSIWAKNVEFIQLDDGAVSIVANETEATALRLYQALLGRTADEEGAAYWVNDVQQGNTVHDIANSFLHSAEFTSHGALTDAEYVQLLYQNALGREAEADGLAYWVNDLANEGYSRAELAISIVGSAEAAEVITTVQILDGLV